MRLTNANRAPALAQHEVSHHRQPTTASEETSAFAVEPLPPPSLTIENVRVAVREELSVIRDDIRHASKWTFWTGVVQGLILYVLGIAATLIISG